MLYINLPKTRYSKNIMEIAKMMALNLLLAIMAFEDFKTMHVRLIWVTLFLALVLAFTNYLYGLIMLPAILIIKKILKDKIAVADIILILSCLFNIPFDYFGLFLLLLGASAALLGGFLVKYNRLERFALIPFIFFAYFVISILLYI